MESNESINQITRAQSYPAYAMQPTQVDGPTGVAKRSTEPTQDEIHEAHDPLSFVATSETYLFPVMTYLLLPLFFGSIGYSIPFVPLWTGKSIWRGIVYAILMILAKAITGLWLLVWPVHKSAGEGRGWRAGLFLGLAMVARGEIGLLISQIAYHTPDPLFSEDEFLIVIWAILLATIIGPIGAGWVIKRWKKDVLLGGWG